MWEVINMSKCKCLKCNVNVNSVNNRCPLCNSELKNWDKNESFYPPKVTGIKHEFLKKMFNSKKASFTELKRGIIDRETLKLAEQPFEVAEQYEG